jgi:hypothetical protein
MACPWSPISGSLTCNAPQGGVFPLLMTPDAIPRTPQPGGFRTRLRANNNWELGVPKCGTGHRRT